MSNNHRPVIVCFGELLWDIVDGCPYIGGAPFNVAAHATRLGLDAYLVSRVGDDDLGRRAVEQAVRHGVKTSLLGCDTRYPTGTVTVQLSKSGQPEYVIDGPVAWDNIEYLASAEMPSFVDAIYFGTLAQRQPASRNALNALLEHWQEAQVYCDLNLRQEYHDRSVIEFSLTHANIVKVNDTEAIYLSQCLFGRSLSLRDFGSLSLTRYELDVLLITLGEDGCLVCDHDGVRHVRGTAVQVADAIGAGDAFSAAFLSSWLCHDPIDTAAVRANTLGAFVASHHGAVPDYTPQLRELMLAKGMPVAW